MNFIKTKMKMMKMINMIMTTVMIMMKMMVDAIKVAELKIILMQIVILA